MTSKVRLVVGLGNPGAEYEGTRHNVGFQVLDHLAAELGTLFRGPSKLTGWNGPRGFDWAHAPAPSVNPDADGVRDAAEARDVFLLKPGTFMNRSGDIVLPVARHLAKSGQLDWVPKVDAASESDPLQDLVLAPDPSSILVVYDDMDLDVGRLRLRPLGGHGGQNGMRSIIHRLATDRFPRLRVGIGRSGTDAARHVLSPFSKVESESIGVSVAEATEAIRAWLSGEAFSDVMTRFHSRWNMRGD